MHGLETSVHWKNHAVFGILLLLCWATRVESGKVDDDWESTAVAKAEKTLRLLSEHCNFETLKCDTAPSDYRIFRLEQPEFSQLAGNETNQAVENGGGNEADIPRNWRDYLHPENFPATAFVQTDQSDYPAQICEGDILTFSCNSSASEEVNQLEMNGEVRWKKATIPFFISPEITGDFRDVVLEAMIMISQNTCVNFVQGNDIRREDIVVFVPTTYDFYGTGFATIGGQNKRKVVKIQYPTYRKGRINASVRGEVLHLLMHVLGFGHEHNRPDRDQYLWINYANIENGHENDFDIGNRTGQAFIHGPYDYDSITHFGSGMFAKDPSTPTLIPKERGRRIGQRDGLSSGDVHKINKLYRCGEDVSKSDRPRLARNLNDEDLVTEDMRAVPKNSVSQDIVVQPSRCPVCVCPNVCTEIQDESMQNGTATLNITAANWPTTSTVSTPFSTNHLQSVPPTGNIQAPATVDSMAMQKMRGNSPADDPVRQMVQGALSNSGLSYVLSKSPLAGHSFRTNPGRAFSHLLPTNDVLSERSSYIPTAVQNMGLRR